MKDRRGFTLVEMLIATALVLLMMLLFAQVFQTAAGLVSNQKGMAKHDQNVRTLTILLRGDMRSRTFVDVVPFVSGQDTENDTGPNYVAERRRGFFSISENDPNDSTDDVLHLTITTDPVSSQTTGSPSLPFSGRASIMFNGTEPQDLDQYLRDNPDQPEFDDGQLEVNQTGSSRYAEVCWFLRNGTLYRRQLLVREPYSRLGNTTEEPQDANGTPFIETTYAGEEHVDVTTNPTGVFWRDFDYAAYADSENNLKFHMPDSLDNVSNAPAAPELVFLPRSLGIPFLRYGSSVSRAFQDPNTLAIEIFGPREYLDESDRSTFIGRFTIEESSHASFAYPGNRTPATDPFSLDPAQPALALADGKVSEHQYSADPHQRRGEDIVMSNVHSFDVKVWDDIVRDFVDLGHQKTGTVYRRNITPPQAVPNVLGWFHQSRNRNPDFGNSFDTWHPYPDMPLTPYAPFGDPAESPNDERPDRMAAQNGGLGSADEVSLRAVQIAIRFYDVGSDTMRDLTFTFPLK